MRDIDHITEKLTSSFKGDRIFSDVTERLSTFAAAAKLQIETMKQDAVFFTVWPNFVAAREKVEQYPDEVAEMRAGNHHHFERGVKLINESINLITYLSEARVPMPKSKAQLLELCDIFEVSRDSAPH